MTQEEKQLLFKDLCARLPYGVVVRCTDSDTDYNCFLTTDILHEIQHGYEYYDYKPYLRPLSSMTEEEVKEIQKINWQFCKPKNDLDECFVGDADDGYCSISQMAGILNYLNAHHFDYRIDPSTGKTLIESGLAVEAPKDMYKTE